jgi:molybdopterin/thiamine biosynthesis adenylyltransferase
MRFSDEEVRRYSRQLVLPEVGGVGQERLRAATATAGSEVEALYLAAAGVGHLVVPSTEIGQAVAALNPHVQVTVDAATPTAPDLPVTLAARAAWVRLRAILAL